MEAQSLTKGSWLNEPPSYTAHGEDFLVTTALESDFWRETSYGFVHDSGHALLNTFEQDSAVELSWILDYDQQFDQAGLLIWSDEKNWIKAGVEFADGKPQLGAVVTIDKSDWSVAPVPHWQGKLVEIRASRSGDAVTIRARCNGDWELVRLAPLDPTKVWSIGLHCASPTREGLTVRYKSLRVGLADASLH